MNDSVERPSVMSESKSPAVNAAVTCGQEPPSSDRERWTDPDATGPFLAFVFLLGCFWVKWRGTRRSVSSSRWVVLLGALAVAALVIGCVNLFSPVTARWRWDLAAFPAVLVGAHGFALFRLRRLKVPSSMKALSEERGAIGPAVGSSARSFAEASDDQVLFRLRQSVNRHFGVVTLILRYGVPAFFMAWIIIGMSNALLRETGRLFAETAPFRPCTASLTEVPWPLSATVGASYGLAGAYCFVVLSLGYRSFRYDISPGAAMWCAVTLATGPIVAGVIGMFWLPVTSVIDAHDSNRLAKLATFFIAGFSPRYGIAIIEEIAKSFWKAAHSDELPKSNWPPLTQLPGITADVAARLAEEGITTVSNMARADPVRLLRSTRYDKGQVVGWIDKAKVMDTLPRNWEGLSANGLSNATMIAALLPPLADIWAPPDPQSTLVALASLAGVDATVLWTTAAMFRVDPQVRLLDLINRLEFEVEGDEDAESTEVGGESSRRSVSGTVTVLDRDPPQSQSDGHAS